MKQFLQQAQFVLVLVALGIMEQCPGGQAEDADQFQGGKAATELLRSRLRISALVFWGIGQADVGAVDDRDPQAVPEAAGPLRVGGGGATQA